MNFCKKEILSLHDESIDPSTIQEYEFTFNQKTGSITLLEWWTDTERTDYHKTKVPTKLGKLLGSLIHREKETFNLQNQD